MGVSGRRHRRAVRRANHLRLRLQAGGSQAQLQSYDPSNPPPSQAIATTTTDNGTTVPYIVRVETGYLDRDQYSIAMLWQPGQPWAPWAPQPQWDHKLVITQAPVAAPTTPPARHPARV